MKAAVHLRVSSDEQAASGLGLEAQLHACRLWADREGFDVAGPFSDDGVSGAAPLEKRAGLLDALAALCPGDVLLVAKRDRLGRDPIVVAMIESAVSRKGCRIISAAGEGTADDDPSSVLMRRLIDAFAEYERLIICARTRAALAAKRRRGERTGQVPYGSAVIDDGRRSKKGDLPMAIVADPAELEVIALITQARADGLSQRKIASLLTSHGIRPKNGAPAWSHTSVAAILRRTAS